MVELLGHRDFLPSPLLANEDGLVAIGGSLDTDILLDAYRKGIFPWYNEDLPIMWWSPDPRMVLFPEKFRLHKSFRQWMRKHPDYTVTRNRAFDRVIEYCATVPRKDQEGTWITAEMTDAYKALHRAGYAVSYEVWNESGQLIGGLYGVDAGNGCFSGESMFSLEPNASKRALYELCRTAPQYGYRLIDAQVYTPYLAQMGGELIPRRRFLELIGYRPPSGPLGDEK